MTAKPVGAGSVWNTNSWHWEEKNVTKVFKESLEQRLLELHMPLTFNEQSGAVKVEAVEISGDAAVSVRKKKRIASFEFTVVMAWVSTCAAAQFADCRGKMKIVELAADDVDDDSYALSVTVDCSDEPHRAVKEALRTAGQAAVRRGIRAWATELKSLSDDQQADTERREDELKKMEAADAEKGELKEQMLAEQQSKEEEGYRQAKAERERERQSFEQLPGAAARGSPPLVSHQGSAEASAWNRHGYHWEEKPQTRWAVAELTERMEKLELDMAKGDIKGKLFNVRVTGDASSSIRKGNKLAFFELTIRADWTATRRAPTDGRFLADAKGGLDIAEFDSENFKDNSYAVAFKCDNADGPRQTISVSR
eukprot:Selendium_serpulae@DN4931_c0_g1_i1.p1